MENKKKFIKRIQELIVTEINEKIAEHKDEVDKNIVNLPEVQTHFTNIVTQAAMTEESKQEKI